jgi:hypothetical protein
VKKIIAVALGGVIIGSVGTMVMVYTVGEASKNGTLHKHPFMKGVAWATSKLAFRNFEPNNQNWDL